MLKNIFRLKIILFTVISISGLYLLFDPIYLLVSLLSYFLLAIIGHFIGLHRYYSHSSFECNKPTEWFIFLCSFMSGMGDPIGYSQVHNRHHLYSDTKKDLLHPTTHPVITWIGLGSFYSEYIDHSKIIISNKLKNKFYLFVNKYYIPLYYLFLILCCIVNFKLSFYFLIVGATLSSHSAHLVNVLCHKYGYRNFNTNDYSTNLRWVNLITLGTGLHNNHHAFPRSYTHKVKQNECDISAWIIKNILAKKVCGLIDDKQK